MQTVVGRGKGRATIPQILAEACGALCGATELFLVWRPLILLFPRSVLFCFTFKTTHSVASPGRAPAAELATTLPEPPQPSAILLCSPSYPSPAPGIVPGIQQASMTTYSLNSLDFRLRQHCLSTYYLHTLSQTSPHAKLPFDHPLKLISLTP